MRIATVTCLAVTLSAGCAKTLTPVRSVAEAPPTARVFLKEQDGALFKLEVINTSPAPIVVYRDAITLERRGAIEPRVPGGVASTYVIKPGRHHAVNVKFNRHGLRHGEPVWINLDHAIEQGGKLVPIEPIELRVD